MKPTERSLPEPEWTPAQIAKGLRDATEHKNQVVIVKSAALQIAKWLEFLPAKVNGSDKFGGNSEREQCARIADRVAQQLLVGSGHEAAKEIARLIREQA